MKKILFAVFILPVFFALSFKAFAEGQPSDAEPLYKIYLPFERGGIVRAVLRDGAEYAIGRVDALPERTRWPSYTASAWGRPGAVTASAVNAVHILMSVEEGQGRTMSVLPSETIAPAAGPGAAIVLDCKGGTSFFGAWAPPVGTKISVLTPTGVIPLEAALPEEGDVLVFEVFERDAPYMVDFENRPGGRVVAWRRSGADVIARVIRPLGGVGRFEGTLYQWPGRIRANHSGVIDISTSDYGTIGGFQIIPWDHALNSKEMQSAWQMTQWMILGPADGKSMMGGTAPLFEGGFVPGPGRKEAMWDLWSTYGRKSLVLARLNGGAWTRLPIAAGKSDDALKAVTHLRVYFPVTGEPQRD
ncbi:MAG: hypothetical protein LBQ36_06340 [Synergistaceae bacterium]|nr:hypothetical protein [Synergistaceae bacterium]